LVAEDLREYIEKLDALGRLTRVKTEVDPELEVAEVLRRAVSTKLGKAILFENVKGSEMRVLGNAFGSEELLRLALGVQSFSEIGEKIDALLNTEVPRGLVETIRSLPKLKEIAGIAPRIVKSGPVKEVVETDDATLESLPALKVWPRDGGKFITFPLVVTKDPDSQKVNIGVYRMQLFDKKTTAMHWQMHRSSALAFKQLEKQGKRIEVAVVIGADPATIFTAVAPVPDAFDEYLFTGFLRGKGLDLVKCETVDLEVPAKAEIVLEGYVNPGEYRLEGPFGDHTGYYTPQDNYPVFHLTALTRRIDPVYLTTVVGKPIQEDAFLASAAGAVFSSPLKLLLPELVDIYLPPEGVFTNLAIVSN